MKSFISTDRNLYYEAPDRIGLNDIEVPKRPSPDHVFVNGQWIDKNNLVQHAPLMPPNFQGQVVQMPVAQQGTNQTTQTNLSDLVSVIKQLQVINGANGPAAQGNSPSAKKDTALGSFMGDKFTWKDLITILYFAGGIVGLWMHMNERIIVLEQKVVSIEKGNAELQSSFKEFTVKNENQLKGIDSKISDLQQMVISRISGNHK